MKTSRQRVLDYIRVHRYVTAAEISRVLKMTPANARHHLSVLADQGVIEVVSDRPTGGKGRPAQVFSLTSQVMGAGLERLAGVALDLLESSLPTNGANSALRLLALQLAGGEYEKPNNSDTSKRPEGERGSTRPMPNLTQRLYAAVSRLNELGYAARWEARADAPRMILGCCPYARILPEHPQLCQMDEFLLDVMLQAPVKQVAKLAHDSRGAPYCMFLVQAGNKPG
jgi:predicted ArsR family transcriptional regulator